MDLLYSVFNTTRKPRGIIGWAAQESVEFATPIDISNQLKSYTEDENYECMTKDKVRNQCYREAIQVACRDITPSRWIEVGTGSDACLTSMVLACRDSTIHTVEGNAVSASRAFPKLRSFIREGRANVLTGLSNSAAVVKALRSPEEPYNAFVQEILGFFAGCEGVAAVVNTLRDDKVLTADVKMVPSHAATFFKPVCISQEEVTSWSNQTKQELMICENVMVLVDSMDIEAAARRTGSLYFEKSGLLEWLDFNDQIPRHQTHVTTFDSGGSMQVNGLAVWIWCKTGTRVQTAHGVKTATGFPYGCEDPDVRTVAHGSNSIAFSSHEKDRNTKSVAIGWNNVFLPFKQTVQCQTLTCTMSAHLDSFTPSYTFKAVTDTGEVVYDHTLQELFPVWRDVWPAHDSFAYENFTYFDNEEPVNKEDEMLRRKDFEALVKRYDLQVIGDLKNLPCLDNLTVDQPIFLYERTGAIVRSILQIYRDKSYPHNAQLQNESEAMTAMFSHDLSLFARHCHLHSLETLTDHYCEHKESMAEHRNLTPAFKAAMNQRCERLKQKTPRSFPTSPSVCQPSENCFLKQGKSQPDHKIQRYVKCVESTCTVANPLPLPMIKDTHCGVAVCPDQPYRDAIQRRLRELMDQIQRWSRTQTPRSYQEELRSPLACQLMILLNQCAVAIMNFIQTMADNRLRPILASVILGWVVHFKIILQNDLDPRHEDFIFEPWTILQHLSQAFSKVYVHMDRFLSYRQSCVTFEVDEMVMAIAMYLSQGKMVIDAKLDYNDCIVPNYDDNGHRYLYKYMTSHKDEDRIMHSNAATTLVYSILHHTIHDLVEGVGTHRIHERTMPVIFRGPMFQTIEVTAFHREHYRNMGTNTLYQQVIHRQKRIATPIIYINDDVDPTLRSILYEKMFSTRTVARHLPSRSTVVSVILLMGVHSIPGGRTLLTFVKHPEEIYEYVFSSTGLNITQATRVDDGGLVIFNLPMEVSVTQQYSLENYLLPIDVYLADEWTPTAPSIREVTESILETFVQNMTSHYEYCTFIDLIGGEEALSNDWDLSDACEEYIVDKLHRIHARRVKRYRWFVPYESGNHVQMVESYVRSINEHVKMNGVQLSCTVHSISRSVERDPLFSVRLITEDEGNDAAPILVGHTKIYVMDAMVGEWIYGCDSLNTMHAGHLRDTVMRFLSMAEQPSIVKKARETVSQAYWLESYPGQTSKRKQPDGWMGER